MPPDLSGLPGAERILRGLRDLGAGIASTDALLVAASRLRALGLAVPQSIP